MEIAVCVAVIPALVSPTGLCRATPEFVGKTVLAAVSEEVDVDKPCAFRLILSQGMDMHSSLKSLLLLVIELSLSSSSQATDTAPVPAKNKVLGALCKIGACSLGQICF